MARIGSLIDGKYEILKEIGRGGMSVVYLASDIRLNKQWAVKEIRKTGDGDGVITKSLLSEAELMKKLDHPALPRIVDMIDGDDSILVVMDYIEGVSLDKVIRGSGPRPEETVLKWGRELCDVLLYLHSRRPPVIYRDMKPANIMLRPDGTLRIIDFGIAREYSWSGDNDTRPLGTKGYAPPEQSLGRTDPRSDIYSLGMTLHHLLTGVDPGKGAMYEPVRYWDHELSEGIKYIIDKCVQPVPENRYQNCAELMFDLEHPDLVTKGYRKRIARKLRAFMVTAAAGVIFLTGGIICRACGIKRNNSTYEYYLSIPSASSFEERTKSYANAVSLYPSRPEAYEKLLEAFGEDGRFDKDESDVFLAMYNSNKQVLDMSDPSVSGMNCRAGLMYFNYYSEEDGNVSFSARVQKAYSFFLSCHENRGEEDTGSPLDISEAYYHICCFYKHFIFSSVYTDEASRSDHEELLDICRQMTYDGGRRESLGAYDRLIAYNGVFDLIYDQRVSFARTGIKEDEPLEILDRIYDTVSKIEVRKDRSKELKKEIAEHYGECRSAVSRAYENERSRG